MADIPKLTPDQVRQLAPADVKRTPSEVIAAMSPQQLEALSVDAQLALKQEQVDALSPPQADALGKAPEVANSETPVGDVKRGRKALQPGIRLIGDAYSQLVTAAGSTSTGAAFGAGVEIETLNGRASITIRRGTEPKSLGDAQSFGNAILTPSVQDFYAGVDFSRSIIRFENASFILSIAGFAQIARTRWNVSLAEAVPAMTDPTSGEEVAPARAATSASADATTFAVIAGPEIKYVASQGENYVEFRALLGFGARGASLDRDADRAVARARAADDRVGPGGFLSQAIGTSAGVFGAVDALFSVRVNSVVVSAAIPYVAGSVSGLSGLSFIPSITLRTGAKLIDL